VDSLTAEVVDGLRESEVQSILLRGPAIARWLYEDETLRPYGDLDLLVAHRDLARAEKVIQALGFRELTVEGVLAHDRPTYAHTWVRAGDRAAIDLHYTLLGVRLPVDEVWGAFAGETEVMPIGGTTVYILDPAGRAVVVTLHAAQHGVQTDQPLDDLARALERLPAQVWDAASSLAARLEATAAFATGLRLLPAGDAVARRLGLPSERSIETTLRATTPPPMALGFEWLAQTSGGRARAALVAGKLFPSVTFMRAWSPLANRGPAGLALAYVWRPIWLALHAGPAFLAWRRARRRVE
jgi:hypothetical protein